MSPAGLKDARGIVYTFYSFKGGVGRSMALANAAALLAQWGHSVLVVDWDLEAPGIERFFAPETDDAMRLRASRPGVVDLIQAKASGTSLDWRECLLELPLRGSSSSVSLISAGRGGHEYVERMQSLNFAELFARYDLGIYIEELRRSWVSSFEFVLIDSRTGLTDIGGICTVHLADVLVLLFTATDSSIDGAIEVVNRAREAREHLPLDRGRLLAVPLPARDESRTEYERATRWKRTFAEKFGFLYTDWLPSGSTIQETIELLRIPYVPYWSFGERLPALEETSGDPAGLSYAYEVLARLLVSRLDWNDALKGHTLAPPPRAQLRVLDPQWVSRQRRTAVGGLRSISREAYVEVYHFCVDSPLNQTQDQLLKAARHAMVHTFGWPIGVVLDREDARPKPTKEGIVAELKTAALTGAEMYDYWTLSKNGDFYTLMSLFEDDREKMAIFFDTRIVRTTEALLHCANLYRALGVDSGATVELTVAYCGLRGRSIKSAGRRLLIDRRVNVYEDEVSSTVVFRLGKMEAEIAQLVEKLCSPLFVLFDFFSVSGNTYDQLVSSFVAGRIS